MFCEAKIYRDTKFWINIDSGSIIIQDAVTSKDTSLYYENIFTKMKQALKYNDEKL